MWGPPPRCGACGRFGSTATEVEGETVCECGSALTARPFFDMPPVTAKGTAPLEPLCGTAQLAMARMNALRLLGDRARIAVRAAGSELAVSVALGDPPRDAPSRLAGRVDSSSSTPDGAGLTLPAHLGVLVLAEGAPFSGGTDATIEVADGTARECLVPRRDARSGRAVTVVLRWADALYERVVTIAP